jgi:glycosyltransferase involved in cell wall biosynthesis
VKPVLFVTNHVPPDRAGAFRALHEREDVELALFGGRSHHATQGVGDPGVPHRHITQRHVHALAGSGDYRAVVCGTAGRTALPAAWRGARKAKVPFLLWSALWAQPLSPAHLLSAPLMLALYRDADAVVTYGPHVSGYVRARGARNVHEAPQAVDNAFWSDGAREHTNAGRPFTALFVGRDAREKGVSILLSAWKETGLGDQASLVLVGAGHEAHAGDGVGAVGPRPPEQVRNFYAQASVAVMASVPSRTFREPWGLVANEAMNQHLPVIATDATGAAAGGLVRHERNGLVVPAGDPGALSAALRRLHADEPLRRQLGDNAARDVAAYTFDAWAAGFTAALASTGTSKGDC